MSIVALARRVIFQAMLDAIDPDAKKWRKDALRFFSNGRLEFWAEIGELSPERVRRRLYDLFQKAGSARERKKLARVLRARLEKGPIGLELEEERSNWKGL
mgnify:CR=1 FL=1